MMRPSRYFTAACMIMLLSMTLCGAAFFLNLPDCGLSELKRVEDIKTEKITLNYAWGKEDESGMRFESSDETDPYGVASAACVAVVSATGNIRQTDASIGQEVVIREICKGDELISVGQTVYVYTYFGFLPVDGHIEYFNTLNLMYPGSDYLIFMDASPLNAYQTGQAYILKSDRFGYVKIQHTDTPTLKPDYRKYDFSELTEYEFFSTSDVITDIMNKAQEDLLKHYL